MKLFNSLKKICVASLLVLTTAYVAIAQVSGSVTVGFGDTGAGNSFGQTVQGSNGTIGGSLLSFMSLAQEMVSRAVPLLIGIAVVVFFAMLVLFIWKSKEGGTEVAKYKGGMLWSVVALFVMVSIWGLVGFLGSVLNIGQGGIIPTPQIPTSN